MSDLTRQVWRNTLIQLCGQVGYLLLGFAWYIKLGRYLGPEGFGVYASLYVYIGFFELLTNQGIETSTVRKISAEPHLRKAWLLHGFILKLILATVAWSVSLLCLRFIPAGKIPIDPYLWIASFTLFYPCFTFFTAYFQSEIKMAVPILSKLLGAVLFLAALFFLAARQVDLKGLVLAKLLTFSVWPLILGFAGTRVIKNAGPFDPKMLKAVFMESVPFFFSSIFILIYYRVDVLMLGWMRGPMEVGYYAAAFRLTDVLDYLPGALMATLLPVFSREAEQDLGSPRLLKGYQYSLKYLTLIILPVAFGTLLLAPAIISFFFKEAYDPSAVTLSILIWGRLFNTIGWVMGYLLIALKRQAINAWINMGMILVNVGLNLILIPSFGFNGAAWATVATEATGTLVWMVLVMGVFQFKPKGWFVRPFAAATAMGVALYFLIQLPVLEGMAPAARLGTEVLAGMMIYSALLLILRVFTAEDVEIFKQALKIKERPAVVEGVESTPAMAPEQAPAIPLQLIEPLAVRKGTRIPAKPRRILILKADGLGDFIMTTPFLREFRKLFPDARLTFLASNASREVAESCPYIDEVMIANPVWFKERSNFWSNLSMCRDLARTLSAGRFDLVVGLRYRDRMESFLLSLVQSPCKIGYDVGGAGFGIQVKLPKPVSSHEIDKHLELLGLWGVRPENAKPEMWLTAEDEEWAELLLKPRRDPAKLFALIHPGSGRPAKQWPPHHFARLSDLLQEKGFQTLFIAASAELPLWEAVSRSLAVPALSCIGATPGQMGALIKRSSIFIGNDSGPTHMAAALGASTLCIFSGTDSSINWAPRGDLVRVLETQAPCKPCGLWACPPERAHACMEQLTPEQVVRATEEALRIQLT